MGYLGGIDDNSKNYAENYKQYGEQVLADLKTKLNSKGIKVFSTDSNESDENSGNVDSCVIVNSPDNAIKNKPQKVDINITSEKKDKNSGNNEWIRDALSDAGDPKVYLEV